MNRHRLATLALFVGLGLVPWANAQGPARGANPAPTAKPTKGKTPVMPVRPAHLITLPDGLAYRVLRRGTGAIHPVRSDTVTANYSLWKANGTFLETTCPGGKCKPATFPLNKLIPGWQEMLPKMTVGEKVQLWLTADLAYGDPPRKPHRPAGPLVFEIELLGIGKPAPPVAR